MSNKLMISTAVLAAAIAVAACEKMPGGQTDQTGSVRSEADQKAAPQRAEPQRPSDQTAVQAGRGETEQASRSSPPAPGPTAELSKPVQTGPGADERAGKSTETQTGPGGAQQASPPSPAAPGGDEQASRASEIGRQQAAKENRNTEDNNQPGQQEGASEPSRGGAPGQSTAEPNHAQTDEAQRDEERNQPGENKQAKGAENLAPEQSNPASGPVTLSREELQRVQMVLKEKGFDIGKIDGVLGARTRNALIAFQRRQGLEATGKIDQSTIAALGVSNPQGSTTGQRGRGAQ